MTGRHGVYKCSPCECGGHDSCTICNPESVLSEAARLVDGDRQTAYGHPKDNHRCTAELWNAYLARLWETQKDLQIDAFDVCMLNILQKVSRLAHTRQRDGLVDIAGFARNAELVEDGNG